MTEGFFFGEKKADSLMSKIYLRGIIQKAKEWEHPCRGFLRISEAVRESGDLLKTPKKTREGYAVSILGLSMQEDTNLDWWVYIPESDPPDGFVMTLKSDSNNASTGLLRAVEVVEHRSNDVGLIERIKSKLKNTSYSLDTILLCLVLCGGAYDLLKLSKELQNSKLELEHIFIAFHGNMIDNINLEKANYNFSLVQVYPKFNSTTFDFRKQFDDFEKKYKLGQELRLIEGDKIFYGTANKKAINK